MANQAARVEVDQVVDVSGIRATIHPACHVYKMVPEVQTVTRSYCVCVPVCEEKTVMQACWSCKPVTKMAMTILEPGQVPGAFQKAFQDVARMAIEVANRHHLAMVFTGRRHFRH